MNELENEFKTDYDVDDSDDENWKMKAHGQEVSIPAGEKNEEENNLTLHLWDMNGSSVASGYIKFTNDGKFEWHPGYYPDHVDYGTYNLVEGDLSFIPDGGGIPLPFSGIWKLQSDGSFIGALVGGQDGQGKLVERTD